MWEEIGTDSFLVRPGRKMFLVVFAGRRMVMDIYFGSVLFPPFNMSVTSLSLLFLMSLDRSKWPRCLLWHGWLPGLNGFLGD